MSVPTHGIVCSMIVLCLTSDASPLDPGALFSTNHLVGFNVDNAVTGNAAGQNHDGATIMLE